MAAKAKSKKTNSVAARFPQLAFDKQEQIEDWEANGWTIFVSEHGGWNAQHPDIAPKWMPQHGSPDGLFKDMARVAALGRPLTEQEQLGWGETEPKDSALGAAIKKTKMEIVDDEVPATSDNTLGRMIPLSLLRPSPTNPRKRFPKESITDLAGSIREQGVLEPLIVRRSAAGYEIVSGERRYRAATQAELKDVPCIERELTDEQVLDIQIHENLHREGVHPLDEALGYKFLQEQLKCDLDELSARVGKPVHYVQNRLKLNDLIPAAKKDLEANLLPVGHALEIVKFSDPKTQKEIHEACYLPSYQGGGAVSLKRLLAYINDQFLLQLSKAPFNINSKDLRKDGLACADCPDRTGAAPGLFEDYKVAKTDSCLNKTCFEAKKQRQFSIKRAAIALDLNVKENEVPVVDFGSYTTSGKGVLGYFDVTQATKADAGKKGVFVGISKAAENYGSVVYFRKKAKESSGSSSKSSNSPKDKDLANQQLEEKWNVSVADVVRWRVLNFASVKWAKQFSVKGGGADFIPSLAALLFNRYEGEEDKLLEIVAGQMSMEPDKLDLNQWGDIEKTTQKIAAFPENVQKQFLYLILHSEKGEMYAGWKSQAEILAIAKEWDIDYRLLDAKARVELSPEKHKQVHEDYLKAIEAGGKINASVKVPRLYSEEWSPKD